MAFQFFQIMDTIASHPPSCWRISVEEDAENSRCLREIDLKLLVTLVVGRLHLTRLIGLPWWALLMPFLLARSELARNFDLNDQNTSGQEYAPS